MRKDRIVKQVLGDEISVSPSELYNKEFKRTSVGGYKPSEVDEFLEKVADAMESMIVQNRVLRERYEELRTELDSYKEMEGTLRNALVSSQRFGEDLLDQAKREAQVLLEEARLKRAQAQLEVSRIPTLLTKDIHMLEQQRQRLRVELMSILETHRKLVDSLIPEDSFSKPASFFDTGADRKAENIIRDPHELRKHMPSDAAEITPIPAEVVEPPAEHAEDGVTMRDWGDNHDGPENTPAPNASIPNADRTIAEEEADLGFRWPER